MRKGLKGRGGWESDAYSIIMNMETFESPAKHESELIEVPSAIVVVVGAGIISERCRSDGEVVLSDGTHPVDRGCSDIWRFATVPTCMRALAAAEYANWVMKRLPVDSKVVVIASGGKTNQRIDLSEAQVMEALIRGITVAPCICEELSYDTGTNIRNVIGLMNDRGWLSGDRVPSLTFITNGGTRCSRSNFLTGLRQLGHHTFRLGEMLYSFPPIRSLRKKKEKVEVLPAELILQELNPASYDLLERRFHSMFSKSEITQTRLAEFAFTGVSLYDSRGKLAGRIARRKRVEKK